jgi:hypothetical protein
MDTLVKSIGKFEGERKVDLGSRILMIKKGRIMGYMGDMGISQLGKV